MNRASLTPGPRHAYVKGKARENDHSVDATTEPGEEGSVLPLTGCKSERDARFASRQRRAQTHRAGENLFFPLSSSAEVIITTAGEFVRLGDKDLNDSLETRQSLQTATRIEITSAFELATLLANLDQSEHFSIEDGIKLENE